jgi:hypothetical protein
MKPFKLTPKSTETPAGVNESILASTTSPTVNLHIAMPSELTKFCKKNIQVKPSSLLSGEI